MRTFLNLAPSAGYVFVPLLLTSFFLSHFLFFHSDGISPVDLLELTPLSLLKLEESN